MPAAAQASHTGAALLPSHIAIIMDGNSRWAAERGHNRLRGHNAGAETLRGLLEACRTRPFIRQLTLYAFSTENWSRPADEVSDLMNLLRFYLTREVPVLNANGIRMRFIGERTSLAPDIQRDLAEVERLTEQNQRLTVTMAVSYGGRQELVAAMRAIAQKVAAGELLAEAIDEATIARHLYTHDSPEPDLVIRTGGDERISNFLLWQSAYAEFYFTDILWPDFGPERLDEAIAAYGQRERRFGRR